MNWTLVAVIGILAGLAFLGARKGIVKMAFSALSLLVIVVLTSFLAPQACKLIADKTTVDETVREKTESYLVDKGIVNSNTISLDDDRLLLPESVKDKIEEKAQEYLNKGKDAYNSFVIDTISKTIYSAAVYVGVFLVLCIAMLILYGVLNVMSKLPVLDQLNRLAGGIIGAVLGLLIVWVLMIVFTSIGNTQVSAIVSNDIMSNPILTFLYDRNLLLNVLVKVF